MCMRVRGGGWGGGWGDGGVWGGGDVCVCVYTNSECMHIACRTVNQYTWIHREPSITQLTDNLY